MPQLTTRSERTDRVTPVYVAGLLALAVGLALVAIDQFVVGSLDTRLHEIYDPVGKYGDPGALYAALYGIGVFGIAAWSAVLNLMRKGRRSAFRWSLTLLAVGAPVVLAPVVITEYGTTIVPLGLSAAYVAAWLLGVIGVIAHWRIRTQERTGAVW